MTGRDIDLGKVKFFVDENFLAVGRALMFLRDDVVVARHEKVRDLPLYDKDWIPFVARRGWVVITNDKHIRTRPHEAPVAVEWKLNCAHIAPNVKNATRMDFIRVISARWTAIEALCEEDGPAWLKLTDRKGPERLSYQPYPGRLPPAS